MMTDSPSAQRRAGTTRHLHVSEHHLDPVAEVRQLTQQMAGVVRLALVVCVANCPPWPEPDVAGLAKWRSVRVGDCLCTPAWSYQ